MKKHLWKIFCAIVCVGLMAVGMGCFPEGSDQKPVVIAIIDTGISTRAIPAENILEGRNYLDPSLSTEDTYGHGTAVASVILKHYPQGQLVPLVSNAYEDGRIRQVDHDMFAQMIRDAVDVYHCQIINLSVGLVSDKPSIREAVAYAQEKGVLIVTSAGNDYAANGDLMYYPAGYESVLAVGSVNQEGTEISAFSQRGEWVDIYACGEDVEIATLSGNTKESGGTSYSAARVTAAAAGLWEKTPNLTLVQLQVKLLEQCKELTDGRKVLP